MFSIQKYQHDYYTSYSINHCSTPTQNNPEPQAKFSVGALLWFWAPMDACKSKWAGGAPGCRVHTTWAVGRFLWEKNSCFIVVSLIAEITGPSRTK